MVPEIILLFHFVFFFSKIAFYCPAFQVFDGLSHWMYCARLHGFQVVWGLCTFTGLHVWLSLEVHHMFLTGVTSGNFLYAFHCIQTCTENVFFNFESYMLVPCAVIEFKSILGSRGSQKLLGAVAQFLFLTEASRASYSFQELLGTHKS